MAGEETLVGDEQVRIVQQRVRLYPELAPLCVHGIPDVRVIMYRGRPAMAMLRLPTAASDGRANLHQGGLGVGIDLTNGVTHHAVQGSRPISRHPDTGATLVGRTIPHWPAILDLSRRVAAALELGFLGVDVVIDPDTGPLLLEVNARPGLAIQHANGEGLRGRLEAIDSKQPLLALRAPKETVRAAS